MAPGAKTGCSRENGTLTPAAQAHAHGVADVGDDKPHFVRRFQHHGHVLRQQVGTVIVVARLGLLVNCLANQCLHPWTEPQRVVAIRSAFKHVPEVQIATASQVQHKGIEMVVGMRAAAVGRA